MCNFFSFITVPEYAGRKKWYFNSAQRQTHKITLDGFDSHDHIIHHYEFVDSQCNKYEYNPFTQMFKVDTINCGIDDSASAEDWVRGLDFKTIIKELNVKPLFYRPEVPTTNPDESHIQWLREYYMTVRHIGTTDVDFFIKKKIQESVGDVWFSINDRAITLYINYIRSSYVEYHRYLGFNYVNLQSLDYYGAAYLAGFFNLDYEIDLSPCTKLMDQGLFPAYDAKDLYLFSGPDARIVYKEKKPDAISQISINYPIS